MVVLLPLFIKFLNRKDKRLKFLFLIPLGFLVYSIYASVYPPDSFYRQDFKEVTGVDFPESGQIVFKTASFPDQHGDYGSVSIIKVDREFFEKLDKHLIAKGLTKCVKSFGSAELMIALKEIEGKTIEREFCVEYGLGIYCYVAFLSDKETLIVYKHKG